MKPFRTYKHARMFWVANGRRAMSVLVSSFGIHRDAVLGLQRTATVLWALGLTLLPCGTARKRGDNLESQKETKCTTSTPIVAGKPLGTHSGP
jgi:hypothetical protein